MCHRTPPVFYQLPFLPLSCPTAFGLQRFGVLPLACFPVGLACCTDDQIPLQLHVTDVLFYGLAVWGSTARPFGSDVATIDLLFGCYDVAVTCVPPLWCSLARDLLRCCATIWCLCAAHVVCHSTALLLCRATVHYAAGARPVLRTTCVGVQHLKSAVLLSNRPMCSHLFYGHALALNFNRFPAPPLGLSIGMLFRGFDVLPLGRPTDFGLYLHGCATALGCSLCAVVVSRELYDSMRQYVVALRLHC
jgi:hypothetical protein